MKNKFMQTTVGTFLALLMLFVITPIFVSGQESENGEILLEEQDRNSRRSIEGVWRAMVTPRDCQTGVQLAPAFNDLLTFHQGGTMSEDGAAPGQSPALRGSGHGLWKRNRGGRNHSVTFTFNTYNASGAFDGSQNVTGNLALGITGNNLAGDASVHIFNANNNQVAMGCATVTGTRFEL